MDVIAKTVTICYSISIETLKTILGENYKDMLFLNFVKMAFKTSGLFKKLNKSIIEKAFPVFKAKNFNKNDVVLSKGYKTNEKIIIVIEGGLINVKIIFKNRAEITISLRKELQSYLRMMYSTMFKTCLTMI